MSNNNSEEEDTPIQPPIDSESWCRYVHIENITNPNQLEQLFDLNECPNNFVD